MPTVELTPPNKDAIVEALHPFVLSVRDVVGAGDLEGLLARYPDIARANFKLWLTSTDVLERVLHNAELCHPRASGTALGARCARQRAFLDFAFTISGIQS